MINGPYRRNISQAKIPSFVIRLFDYCLSVWLSPSVVCDILWLNGASSAS